jgi:alpha-tubulin suppressor-like RCC1 family protein
MIRLSSKSLNRSAVISIAAMGLLSPLARAQVLPHHTAPVIPVQNPPFPHPVLAPYFVQITAGNYHTCALRSDNRVYCWGRDDVGQLGIAPTVKCQPGLLANNCINQPTFNRVLATQIDAGFDHTCTILSLHATCWGLSNMGQDGNAYGDTSANGPVPVSGNLNFTRISAGGNSTCGVVNQLAIYCWGDMPPNQNTGNPTPQQLYVSATPIATLAVGSQYACAMTQGTVVNCFGMNQVGQAGGPPFIPTNFGNQIINVPNPVVNPPGPSLQLGPVANVYTQASYTCVVLTNGAAQCFGIGPEGELGNGSSGPGTWSFTPQPVGSGIAFASAPGSFSTGLTHACAIDTSGAAWCWGSGIFGELGNGTSGVFALPQRVQGNHVFRLIAAGSQHTCAVDTVNQIYCWGATSFGQLGNQQIFSGFWPTPYPTNPLNDN